MILQKGIALNPSSPEMYYALCFVYLQSNDKVKAKQMVVKLKELDPNNPDYQQLFKNFGI